MQFKESENRGVVLYQVWLTQLTFANKNDDDNANRTTNDQENGTHHKQRNVPIEQMW